MNRYVFFILCVLPGLLPLSAAVREELRGRVVDADTGEPVAGCIVKSKVSFTSADREGRFVIAPAEGADSLSFRSIGYESVSLAAAGVQPLLYNGSLYTMCIGPKTQNIITLKADNTGWNPANEIREHVFDDMFSSGYDSSIWPEYISADIVNAPLTEKRTRDNLSWLANAITAWKKGDTSMRLNLNYTGDRLDYNSGLTTDYFSNLIPPFVQHNSQRTQAHDLSAQFYSQTNKRGYFLNEKFSVAGALDKSNSAISGSFNLGQRVDRKGLSANNDLKLVKRNEKKLFTLISRNTFSRMPDRLSVAGDENAVQSIGTTDFRSTTETKFGHMKRFWKYYVSCGLDLDWHRLNSTLAGLGDFDNTGIHDAFLSNLYAGPQVDYERNRWRASLSVPLKWLHYSVAGRHSYINTSPRLYVKRQLTAKYLRHRHSGRRRAVHCRGGALPDPVPRRQHIRPHIA